eukprot:scaffold149_cov315-Pinguiococcus_pyrenoidosus.AAC.120
MDDDQTHLSHGQHVEELRRREGNAQEEADGHFGKAASQEVRQQHELVVKHHDIRRFVAVAAVAGDGRGGHLQHALIPLHEVAIVRVHRRVQKRVSEVRWDAVEQRPQAARAEGVQPAVRLGARIGRLQHGDRQVRGQTELQLLGRHQNHGFGHVSGRRTEPVGVEVLAAALPASQLLELRVELLQLREQVRLVRGRAIVRGVHVRLGFGGGGRVVFKLLIWRRSAAAEPRGRAREHAAVARFRCGYRGFENGGKAERVPLSAAVHRPVKLIGIGFKKPTILG